MIPSSFWKLGKTQLIT
ncbi:hypothetical protein LINGRAHAP2_LOCUS20423 [Linum grandiflorum]